MSSRPHSTLQCSFSLGILLALSSSTLLARVDSEEIQIYDLPLEQLLQIEVDLSGESVQNIALDQIPQTPSQIRTMNMNLPYAVEIVDHQSIEARGMRNVVDVAHNMTGVISGETPSEPYSFSMRGFSRESVKVLYDGVSMGVSTLNMRPIGTNNLSRVEVVKGPVVLIGEGGAGGTINIIPKRAKLTSHAIETLNISYGSYDSIAASVDASGPLGDNAGYLVSIDKRQSNGWVDDSDSDELSISSSVFVQVTDDLSLSFSIDYFEDELPAYWGTPFVPENIARSPEKVVSTDSGEVIDLKTRYKNYNVSDQIIDSDSYWLKAKANWTISDDLSLVASLYQFDADRHWQNAESYIAQPATLQVSRDRLLVTHDREIVGVNTALVNDAKLFGFNNQVSFGLEYSDNDFKRQVGFDTVSFFVDEVDLYNPEPGIFHQGNIEVRHDTHFQETLALIFENHLALTESWSIDIGLRADQIDFEVDRYNFDGSSRADQDEVFKHISYRAGVGYQLADHTSLYGNVAQQYDPLQKSASSFGVAELAGFDPSEVNQIEVGVKSSLLDQSLEYTAAIFDIDRQSKVSDGSSVLTNQHNSQGAEVTFKYRINERLDIGGHFTYIDAGFDNYYDADNGRDVSGNTPINIPENQGSFWLSYDLLFSLPIEVGANVDYVSDVYADTANSVKYNAYTLFNGFIAYTGNNYRIAIHGRNLTDEVYASFSEPFYPTQVLLGAPRTYDISFKMVF